MPELPDITVYIEHLRTRIEGKVLEKAEVASPFLLRTVDPPLSDLVGRAVQSISRVGKRIVWFMGDELYLVLHLMIAGRLHWRPAGAKLPAKMGLAAFRFAAGTLTLTESGSKKRASMHVFRGRASLDRHDPGGLEIFEASLADFTAALTRENHTLKRALTDPHLFSGIGNAYSDEVLHAARLSPLALTHRLQPDEVSRLFEATKKTLEEWTDKLRLEAAGGFPEKVTAFRSGMAVHGRYGQACPVCGSVVQRIVYAENETNYCPGCQTSARLLADRSLSRLLRDDWPRTVEEWEEQRRRK